MFPTRQGALRLFRFAGIGVWLHWSWLIAALWVLNYRQHLYASPVWNAAEWLALFGLVMLHEFGHALACRSVGGRRTRLCCGRWAEWPTWRRRRDRARTSGASWPDRW